MFTLITLITYLLSCYSCFDLPWLAFAYLSLHLTVPCVLTYQHTWFCLFISFCSLHQSFFVSVTSVRQILILRFPPPGSCLSLFTLYHFSFFSSPLTLPAFTSASLLHLPVLFFVWPLFSAVVRVSRTEGESVCSGKTHAIPQHRTRTQSTRTC